DRATRPVRGQLHDVHVIVVGVVVEVEAHRAAVAGDRAIDIRDGQDDDVEGPGHAGMMPATPRTRSVLWDSTYAPALEEGPGSMTRTDRLALAAGLTTVFFWASAFVGIRAAAVELSPGAIAFGRVAIGAIALGVLVAIRRPPWPARRDLIPIAVIGVLWFGIYFLALNAAEREVDAGTASMLVNVAPIFIAILSGLFLGEGFPPRLLIGCVIAFSGVVVILLATSGAQPGGATLLGIALCFVSAIVYSIAVTIPKPLLRRAN